MAPAELLEGCGQPIAFSIASASPMSSLVRDGPSQKDSWLTAVTGVMVGAY